MWESRLGHFCPLKAPFSFHMFSPAPSQILPPSLRGGWIGEWGWGTGRHPWEDRTQETLLTPPPQAHWGFLCFQAGSSPGSPWGLTPMTTSSKPQPTPQPLLGPPRGSGAPWRSGWEG